MHVINLFNSIPKVIQTPTLASLKEREMEMKDVSPEAYEVFLKKAVTVLKENYKNIKNSCGEGKKRF